MDLSDFRATEVSATYDSRTFASMGYTLVDNEWHKNDSVKVKIEAPKLTKISADSAVLTKEVDKIKASLLSLTNFVQDIHETLANILRIGKDSSTDLGKLQIEVKDLKKEGVRSLNKLIK